MLDRCHGIDKHAGDQSRFGGPGHRIGPRPGERRQPRHGDVVTQDSGRGQQNPGCFRQWGHQIADQHGDVVPTRQAAGGMGGDERGEIAGALQRVDQGRDVQRVAPGEITDERRRRVGGSTVDGGDVVGAVLAGESGKPDSGQPW